MSTMDIEQNWKTCVIHFLPPNTTTYAPRFPGEGSGLSRHASFCLACNSPAAVQAACFLRHNLAEMENSWG